jgi:hypothetical protein
MVVELFIRNLLILNINFIKIASQILSCRLSQRFEAAYNIYDQIGIKFERDCK